MQFRRSHSYRELSRYGHSSTLDYSLSHRRTRYAGSCQYTYVHTLGRCESYAESHRHCSSDPNYRPDAGGPAAP